MDRRQLRPLFETRFATSVAAGPITRPGELGFLFGLPCFMTQPDGLAEIIGDEGVQALGSQQRPVPGSAILNIRLLGYTYAGVYADKAEPRPIYLVQVDPVQLGEMSGRSEALYQARYVEYHELMAEIKRRGMDRSPQHNFAAANDAFLQGFLAVRFSSGPGF
jgi:hypothetical protein